MTLHEQIALVLVAAGAELIAAATRLRQTQVLSEASTVVVVILARLDLLQEASAALETGNEGECRRILAVATGRRPGQS